MFLKENKVYTVLVLQFTILCTCTVQFTVLYILFSLQYCTYCSVHSTVHTVQFTVLYWTVYVQCCTGQFTVLYLQFTVRVLYNVHYCIGTLKQSTVLCLKSFHGNMDLPSKLFVFQNNA